MEADLHGTGRWPRSRSLRLLLLPRSDRHRRRLEMLQSDLLKRLASSTIQLRKTDTAGLAVLAGG